MASMFPSRVRAARERVQPEKPRKVIDTIDAAGLSNALRIGNRNEAIKAAVDLYVEPLIRAADRAEDPPNFWFVVIPEEVYKLGRPQSKVPAAERVKGRVKLSKAAARDLLEAPTFFPKTGRRGRVPVRHAL